ncbi:MAG: peptidase [Deltaproteobacteria bacterium]|nr:MAG: peptidase [Deltaproteobacteria bacterium]
MTRFLLAVVVVVLVTACAGPGQSPQFGDLLGAELGKALGPAGTGGDGIPLAGTVSDADEQALGREIAGRLLAAYPLVRNDAVQRYVNQVGRYVAAQGPRPGLNWTFGVIQNDDINAFAAPGGYIFVTRGLYRMLGSEAELAGVLGHEMVHINERHYVRLLQQQRILALGQEFLLGRVKNATVQQLAGNGVELYARSLDKDAEFACDRLGIQYAARAGYDPFAYLAVLDRLGADTHADQLALLYKTHPHPAARLDALETLIGSRWDGLGGKVDAGRWVRLD